MSDQPTKVNRTEARQGRSGLGVIYMTVGGTALVIIAFALVWMLTRA